MQPSAANCIFPLHQDLAVLQLHIFFPVQAKFEVKEVCFGCMRGALATSHMKACLRISILVMHQQSTWPVHPLALSAVLAQSHTSAFE